MRERNVVRDTAFDETTELTNSVETNEEARNQTEMDESSNYEDCFYGFCNTSAIVENPILKDTATKIKQTLLRRLKDCIIVSGLESSGRRTAVQFIARELEASNDLPDRLLGIKFIRVEFPEEEMYTDDVTNFLLEGISKYYKAGIRKLVLVLDDLEALPVSFLSQYYSVKFKLQQVGFDLLKFIMILDDDPMEDDCEFVHKHTTDERELEDYEILQDAFLIPHDLEVDFLEIVKNLRPQIDELEKEHNVKASNEILEQVLLMKASKLKNSIVPYYAAIHNFDCIMGIAEEESRGSETIEVGLKHLKQMFSDDYEVFDNFSEDVRERIAYHECGHALLMLLDNDLSISVNGIRIVPDCSTGANGITYTLDRVTSKSLPTRKYVVTKIAMDLAGRIAEASENIGAESDMDNANSIARDFVLNSGLTKMGKNYICQKDDFFISDFTKVMIEKEIKELLEEAESYARKAIWDYDKFLEELVQSIIPVGVMSVHKVKEIWSKYKKS